jgi:hypothetical protein
MTNLFEEKAELLKNEAANAVEAIPVIAVVVIVIIVEAEQVARD